MNKDIEKLIIYNKYIDLFYYSYNIIKKYPKSEKYILCSDIKRLLEEGYKYIIYAYYEKLYKDKYNYLKEIYSNLTIITFYIRISYKEKYISLKNYESWSRKINSVLINLNNWMISCQRKLK